MLDVLKPPTDNLYKFIALTGLLLSVLSIALPAYALVTLELKRLEALKELMITKAEIQQTETIKLELDAATKAADAAMAGVEAAKIKADRARKLRLSTQKIREMDEAIDELRKATDNLAEAGEVLANKTEAYRKKVDTVQLRTLDNEYQTEVIQSIDEGVFLSKFFMGGGVILGLVLCTAGFTLWYRKVQALEDRILEEAAAKTLNRTDESQNFSLSEQS